MPTASTTRLAAQCSAPQRGSRPCGARFYASAFLAPKISAFHPERASFARERSQPPRFAPQPTVLRLCSGRRLLVLRYEGSRAASCAMLISIPYNRTTHPCSPPLSGVRPCSRVCLSLVFPRDRRDRLLASSTGAPHADVACGAWVTVRRCRALLDPMYPQSPDLEADCALHSFTLALFAFFTSSSRKPKTYNLKLKTPRESRA
jgi:hypothetical protein